MAHARGKTPMRCEVCERKNPLASLGSSVLPKLSPLLQVDSVMFGLRRGYESHLSSKHQDRSRSQIFLERRGVRSD